MKKTALFFWVLWFLCLPFSQNCKAELTADIKNILLKITSSVIDQRTKVSEIDEFLFEESLLSDYKKSLSDSPESILQLYFPLNNYDIKTYSGTVSGQLYQTKYNYYTTYFNGSSCYREDDSLDGSKTYYGYSGNEILIYGAALENEIYPLNKPLPILNESILTNGGSLQSSTTLNVEGYLITLNLTVTSQLTGIEYIPLGSVDNCRSIEMTFSYSIPGESETLDMEEVWILAPKIGKLKIAVLDQFMIRRGWLSLAGGTVGGENIVDIFKPPDADFTAEPLNGLPSFLVNFTDQSSGTITNWSWDFGDGSTSIEKNSSHTYSMPGKYQVSLTVSGSGGSDTEIKSDYIMIASPAVDLNDDDSVDMKDLFLVLSILKGEKTIPAPSKIADINGDMKTGMEEAVYILQVLSHGSHK